MTFRHGRISLIVGYGYDWSTGWARVRDHHNLLWAWNRETYMQNLCNGVIVAIHSLIILMMTKATRRMVGCRIDICLGRQRRGARSGNKSLNRASRLVWSRRKGFIFEGLIKRASCFHKKLSLLISSLPNLGLFQTDSGRSVPWDGLVSFCSLPGRASLRHSFVTVAIERCTTAENIVSRASVHMNVNFGCSFAISCWGNGT